MVKRNLPDSGILPTPNVGVPHLAQRGCLGFLHLLCAGAPSPIYYPPLLLAMLGHLQEIEAAVVRQLVARLRRVLLSHRIHQRVQRLDPVLDPGGDRQYLHLKLV